MIYVAFNLTQMTNPWIQYSIWYQSEFGYDGAVIQYSLDSGLNWNRIGNFNDSGTTSENLP